MSKRRRGGCQEQATSYITSRGVRRKERYAETEKDKSPEGKKVKLGNLNLKNWLEISQASAWHS